MAFVIQLNKKIGKEFFTFYKSLCMCICSKQMLFDVKNRCAGQALVVRVCLYGPFYLMSGLIHTDTSSI